MHGDVMNACDVSQRIEWGQFDTQTHELIDKVLVRHVQQHRIFTATGVYPAFLLCQYRKVQRRVERKRLALETIQTFEELQQKQTAAACSGVSGIPEAFSGKSLPSTWL